LRRIRRTWIAVRARDEHQARDSDSEAHPETDFRTYNRRATSAMHDLHSNVPVVLSASFARAGRMAFALALLALLAIACGCASIPEGRASVDSVKIRGASEVNADDITDRLATTASPKFLGLFRGIVYDYSVYDASVLQRDLARVERYYRGRGFLDAHARAARVRHDGSDHVRVTIVVDEGLPTLDRALQIHGLEGLPAADVAAVVDAANHALPRGKRFDEDAYKQAQTDVVSALTDRGYAYATVKAEAHADLGAHAIDYDFTFTPGIVAVFGPITFTGLDADPKAGKPNPVDEKPLRRAIDIRKGDKYSSAEIQAATQALLDLEVFSAVTIEPALSDPTAPVVPLVVKVQQGKLRLFRVGFGAEFDAIKTDVHGLIGWEDHDFLGGLRDFSVELKPGLVLYPTKLGDLRRANGSYLPDAYLPEERLRLQLRQPGFLEARTVGFVQPELNVYPLLVEENPDPNTPVVGYVEPKTSVGLNRRFGKHLNATIAYNVQGEVPFAYPPQRLDSQFQSVVLLFPQLITTVDFRDNAVHPHLGFYLANDLEVAGFPGSALPSDVRVEPEARGYLPLGRDVTVALRGMLGFLFDANFGPAFRQDLADVAKNPPVLATNNADLNRDLQSVYFRGFFEGGPSSNRGFPIRGIAPHGVVPFLNPAGVAAQVLNCTVNGRVNTASCVVPIAGFSLWQASAEVRFDVSGPLGITLFCDAGDVSAETFDIRLDHLHMSCGVGARYDTPVGPIRLDLGYRIPPLQVLGSANETEAFLKDPTEGTQPTLFGQPLSIAFGLGEAF
jgi:outer membrane protein assembly factor BamA